MEKVSEEFKKALREYKDVEEWRRRQCRFPAEEYGLARAVVEAEKAYMKRREEILEEEKKLAERSEVKLKEIETFIAAIDKVIASKKELLLIGRGLVATGRWKQEEVDKVIASKEGELLKTSKFLLEKKDKKMAELFNYRLDSLRKSDLFEKESSGELEKIRKEKKTEKEAILRERDRTIARINEEIVRADRGIEASLEQYGSRLSRLSRLFTQASKDVEETSPLFKGLYHVGAKRGVDYIVISDGERYMYPDNEYKSVIFDYEEMGYIKGKPCSSYNGGAHTVFDGETLILTTDSSLIHELEIVGVVPPDKRGGIPFFNSEQKIWFDDASLDWYFSNMVRDCYGEGRTLPPYIHQSWKWPSSDDVAKHFARFHEEIDPHKGKLTEEERQKRRSAMREKRGVDAEYNKKVLEHSKKKNKDKVENNNAQPVNPLMKKGGRE